MDTLPKCVAKSKQSGSRCKNYAVKNKTVCWIHGGKSKGPSTAKGREKIRKSKTKHGMYSQMAIDERKLFRDLMHHTDTSLKEISDQILSKR
jgi:hypothetical protein